MKFWPAICLVCLSLQTPAGRAQSTASPPLPPPVASPVAVFRELLALAPEARQSSLSNRPPEVRQRLLTKLEEYQGMTPEDRELRLRVTELRWYLTPLLSLPATNRASRLAQIPSDIRTWVEARLAQWTILPAPLRDQVLEEDRHLQLYFQLAGSTAEQQQRLLSQLPDTQRATVEAGFARWQKLTPTQREEAMLRVNRFFDLQPAEKQQVLSRLSAAERRQMELSLRAFEKLPRAQRNRCLEAIPKFASLSPAERAEFLVNAERWQALTASERELFRRLVQQAPPPPPMPGAPLPRPTTAATNRGG